jgi:4-amino-4-deoxy-L-arabinose transferase-like glycosyltransferase
MSGRILFFRSPAVQFGVALVGLTALRLIVSALVPVSPDEAYYWVWSRAIAPGYLDHPPMVALWTWVGTALFGNGAFGIRLLAPLAAAFGSLLVVDAARRLGAGRGYAAALLLNATLLFGAGGILMTPDTPLMLFWIATLWAMARLVSGGSGWWWIAVGIAAGFALDSKYTAALLLLGIGLWLILLPAGRRWLRDPRPWLGGAIALLLFLPVILWNADRHWVSFLKQGGRTADFHPARALQFIFELIAGQLGLATPVVFVLCALGLISATRRTLATRDPSAGLLVALGVVPAVVFLEHALGGRVQGNWPGILYPAAVIAAIAVPLTMRWIRPALGIGFAMTVIVYLQAMASPIPIGGVGDPTIRVLGGWAPLAASVTARAQAMGAHFVVIDEYGLGSELALRLPGTLPVVAQDPRWLLFALPRAGEAVPEGTRGLLVRTDRRRTAPDTKAWGSLYPIGDIGRGRYGRIGESYTLYSVTAGPDAGGILTRLPSGASP